MQTPAVLTFLHMLAAAGGLRLASQYDVFERMQVGEEGRGGAGGAGDGEREERGGPQGRGTGCRRGLAPCLEVSRGLAASCGRAGCMLPHCAMCD